MKKVFVLLVALVLLVVCSACSNKDESPKSDNSNVTETSSSSQSAQLKSVKVDDIVTFGHYEQDNDLENGAEPIEWIVLDYDETNHKALLLSKYGLDTIPYNTERTDVTWETCSLRSWLNDEFLNTSFTPDEQAAILMTEVDNSAAQGYSKWNTDGGKNTQDKIFLLSFAEANQYLGVTDDDNNNSHSCVVPTDYAIERGAWTNEFNKTADAYEKGEGVWWLRSPSFRRATTAVVDDYGTLSSARAFDEDYGVARPAFWLDLKSD